MFSSPESKMELNVVSKFALLAQSSFFIKTNAVFTRFIFSSLLPGDIIIDMPLNGKWISLNKEGKKQTKEPPELAPMPYIYLPFNFGYFKIIILKKNFPLNNTHLLFY